MKFRKKAQIIIFNKKCDNSKACNQNLAIIFKGVFSLWVKLPSATLCEYKDITFLEIQTERKGEWETQRDREKECV